MSLSDADVQATAAALLKAEQSLEQIGLISLQYPDITLDDAYAIQKAQIDLKLAAGRTIQGWKIGLTSKIMQDALGISTPDSGVLYDDMFFQSGSVVPKARFIQPRIEAEIAFVLKDTIAGNASREEVLDATDYVTPAIEILDTRILRKDPASGKSRVIYDTVSDNAANAGIVTGDARHDPRQFDLRWTGAVVYADNNVVATGLGAAVLDDPVESVLWLSRRMETYGQRLEAGQTVLSGSFVAPIECPPGTSITADFGPFSKVSIDFA